MKVINTITIFLIGIYILILYIRDELDFYIHPRYELITGGAGVIIFLIGLFLLFSLIKESIQAKKFSINLKRVNFLAYIFLFIIVVAIILPARSLSSTTVSQREADLNALNADYTLSTAQKFSQNTENFSLKDWVVSLKFNPDFSLYDNREADVSGFIFNPPEYEDDIFLVSRFVITCCAIDARPVGLLVYSPGWVDSFKKDEWIRVKGRTEIIEKNGQELLVLNPENIETIDTPNDPYIY